MDRYIGLDAHLESCTFAVMSSAGRRLREQRVDTSASTLKSFLRSIQGERHLCLEEGSLSEWLCEILEPLTVELVVVQPEKCRGNKSDALDAWARAEELRTGAARRRVFKSPGKYRGLREAVRNYEAVVGDQVRVKQRLRALLASRGIRATSAVYAPGRRDEWTYLLPSAHKRRADSLGDELDRLADVFDSAYAWLKEEANRIPEVGLLSTAPGIGVVRASQIVAAVVTPHRFRTKRQFWSYCGLGLTTYSSSNWKRNETGAWAIHKAHHTRGLNRRCNRTLKGVYKGGAMSIIARVQDDPLRDDYNKLIARGLKPPLARVTIARRLAGITLAMWKNGETYTPRARASDTRHA